MEKQYDVLVVGACTAGLYFAALMARKGYKVLVIDKDGGETLGSRYDIFHLAKKTFDRFGVEPPKPGDAEYVRELSQLFTRSALDKYPKTAKQETFVLRRHPFMLRLAARAREQGADVMLDAHFENLTYSRDGKISGAVLTHKGEPVTVAARLVADASGAASAVRASLPDGYGVENFPISPRDKFFMLFCTILCWKTRSATGSMK